MNNMKACHAEFHCAATTCALASFPNWAQQHLFPNRCVQRSSVMARSEAAHSVRAPSDKATACIGRTQERPAAELPTDQPTQRWCSDCGKERANVTGKSARADGLHPSWALGLDSTEAASGWSGRTHQGHPAAAMERRP